MVKDILAPAGSGSDPLPIWVAENETTLPEVARRWMAASGFVPKAGAVLVVPADKKRALAGAVVALGTPADPLAAGALARALPAGDWQFAAPDKQHLRLMTLGFCLGAYRFERYVAQGGKRPRLITDKSFDPSAIHSIAQAVWLARDLINTPANDMGPDAIEAAVRTAARRQKATVRAITGDGLVAKGFPMIHAVGRASSIAPRLIDMRWGKRTAPKLTLVGKGVSFDTGGVNLKPSGSMRNMKKDMGGAANALALAQMIMDAGLNVRLRLLIPAVENSVSGNAFHPGDVYPTRKGITVEIGHTDAEGRLILADALTLADEEKPDMLIDMATLTGAARVALGPQLVPFFTDDETVAEALSRAAASEHDPLWRLPLWRPYEAGLSSTVADCNNVTTDGFAGAVTAALFLQKFVEHANHWVHLDMFAWTPKQRPHAPVGGEAQAIRAVFAMLRARYGD